MMTKYFRRFVNVSLALGLLLGCTAIAAAQEIKIEKDVAVPMRDGIILRADVMLPTGTGPFPTLVYRTPYNKKESEQRQSTA